MSEPSLGRSLQSRHPLAPSSLKIATMIGRLLKAHLDSKEKPRDFFESKQLAVFAATWVALREAEELSSRSYTFSLSTSGKGFRWELAGDTFILTKPGKENWPFHEKQIQPEYQPRHHVANRIANELMITGQYQPAWMCPPLLK